MRLTKGTKPERDLPKIFDDKSYRMTKTGNYIEIDTDDQELIAWLQEKGFT